MSTERKPIDWTKPIETVDGRPAKWLHRLLIQVRNDDINTYPNVLAVLYSPASEGIAYVDDYGSSTVGTPFIRNVPERRVVCVTTIGDGWRCTNDSGVGRQKAKAIVTIYECDGRYEAEVEHV